MSLLPVVGRARRSARAVIVVAKQISGRESKNEERPLFRRTGILPVSNFFRAVGFKYGDRQDARPTFSGSLFPFYPEFILAIALAQPWAVFWRAVGSL